MRYPGVNTDLNMRNEEPSPLPAYPRDLVGYGRRPPHAAWPGKARIALQFVLNYEEGGENSVLHGDAGSEQFLSEMFNRDWSSDVCSSDLKTILAGASFRYARLLPPKLLGTLSITPCGL